jgi:hypothetical protein
MHINSNEGPKGFFRGSLLCLIRVTPSSAITLGVYEFLKVRLTDPDAVK